MPTPEVHLIILDRNRNVLKTAADASVELTEIHEAFEAMPSGSAKTAAANLIDSASDTLADFNTDYAGQIEAIKTAVGI